MAALVTQAQADGLAVHQMGGFDTGAVHAGFGLGEDLTPVVVLAVGRQDGAAACPGRWPPARPPRGPGTRSATCCSLPPPHVRWRPEGS